MKAFASAEAFLDALRDDGPACLIVEAQLPGLGGLDLQDLLLRRASSIPVILVADQPAVSAVVRAMRAGAIDFLEKPLGPDTLDDAVTRALPAATARWEADLQRRTGRERLARLTPRERQVLAHLVAGRRNKQIASDLATKEATVKVHRSRSMRKLRVRSLPERLSLILPVMSPEDGEMVRGARAPGPGPQP